MRSGSGGRAEEPYWEEYPIGVVGELLRTVSGVLVGLLIGLGVTLALIIGIGLIVESSSGEVASMYDQLARASMLPLLIVTPSAAVLWAISGDVADLATVRAIRRAAERGAPVEAVPHPYQVRVVVEPPLTRVFGVLFFVLVTACLGVVTMVIMPFTEGHVDDYVPIGLLGSLVVGALAAAGMYGRKVYRVGYSARAARSPSTGTRTWRPAPGGGRARAPTAESRRGAARTAGRGATPETADSPLPPRQVPRACARPREPSTARRWPS
ncbi:hypothetical protein NLU66_00340 [Brachybacterium sp. NBEC-018]|uniref:hypothetical protein n=1 Tax=Brachybacterium sp. NBEC-018 TaxID=2996004 RepID=UPI002174F12A|nr:hypothetical protein [Brachybacterium sp. NBEC-018]UVY84078.1 hypothetical protein NLU66_00340 [Brachybacterium sp. NBEC-018]